MQQQFDEIISLLDKHGIKYEVTEHEPVYTSEDAARIRGEDIRTGAKALIFKTDDNFILCIIPGDKRIDMKKLREITHCKDIRMATPEEVLRITGCEIGSVHPVGTLMRIKTYADRRLFNNDRINFNAGLHTASIRMKSKDFQSVVNPTIVDYARS
jgi:Ala-tRNA(Pro) deacylase